MPHSRCVCACGGPRPCNRGVTQDEHDTLVDKWNRTFGIDLSDYTPDDIDGFVARHPEVFEDAAKWESNEYLIVKVGFTSFPKSKWTNAQGLIAHMKSDPTWKIFVNGKEQCRIWKELTAGHDSRVEE